MTHDLTIEHVPIDKLNPWPRNPRTDHAVDAIARSIESKNLTRPDVRIPLGA